MKSRDYSALKNWTPNLIEELFLVSEKYPKNRFLKMRKQEVLDEYLPPWHLPMLLDDNRNNFFFKMIKKNVKNKMVLDIGSGTGLLSLFAAQHGARHVYACESNPLLYVAAKTLIDASPFRDKISLFYSHSKDLRLGKQIPAKVDLIIAEIFSTDIFSEHFVSTLKDSKRLLKKTGKFLPSHVSVCACLIDLPPKVRVQRAEMKSITEFQNYLGPQRILTQLHNRNYRIVSKIKVIKRFPCRQTKASWMPIQFSLKRLKKSADTYLCVFFKISSGGSEISSFKGQTARREARHWGQVIFKTDCRAEYKFEIDTTPKSKMTIFQF